MSVAQELNALALRKELLRMRIAARRALCAAAVEQLAPTIAFADRGAALWRAIPGRTKWIGLPVALLLLRKFGKRFGGAASLLRYAPAAMQMAQMFAEKRRRESADASQGVAK